MSKSALDAAMAKKEGKAASAALKDILLSNPRRTFEVIRAVMLEVLEAGMDAALGAQKGERMRGGLAAVSAYRGRALITRSASGSCAYRSHRVGSFASRSSRPSATNVRNGPGRDTCGDVWRVAIP